MSKPSWTWAAAASATLAGVAAAVLVTGAAPARSDDGEDEPHTPPRDFEFATTAVDAWDTDGDREDALAAYFGLESGEALLAPFEDPTFLDNR